MYFIRVVRSLRVIEREKCHCSISVDTALCKERTPDWWQAHYIAELGSRTIFFRKEEAV